MKRNIHVDCRALVALAFSSALVVSAGCDLDENRDAGPGLDAGGPAADAGPDLDAGKAGDADADAGPVAAVAAVRLDEYVIVAEPATVAAGEVTFRVTNAGAMPHELMVIRTSLAPDQLPTNELGAVDEDQVDVAGAIEAFPAGQTRELTLELAPGSYVLICNLLTAGSAHYALGMRAPFTVHGGEAVRAHL